MRHRPLGGLLVSELALGTMVFGEDGPRGTPPDDAARMIDRFLDAGGNHIDTADVYAGGRSEEIVGRALTGKRDRVVLATKVRFRMGTEPNDAGLSRRHIVAGVDASLRRLATDWIDLLYAHCWDPVTPLEETLRAFDDLVTAGKVRYIGVSNFTAWQLMKALGLSDHHGWARFVAAQYQYSLVTRDIEREFTELFHTEGVGLVPWSPLGGGFLTGKYTAGDRPEKGRLAVMGPEAEEAWERRATTRNWDIVAAAEAVAAGHGTGVAQVALAWLRARPTVASTILGVRTEQQLEDNLASLELALSDADVERLDAASAPEPGYPYRFIADYGARPEAVG